MIFPTASLQPRPIRLSGQIRDWAWRSMHGEFGDEAMTHRSVSLDDIDGFDQHIPRSAVRNAHSDEQKREDQKKFAHMQRENFPLHPLSEKSIEPVQARAQVKIVCCFIPESCGPRRTRGYSNRRTGCSRRPLPDRRKHG